MSLAIWIRKKVDWSKENNDFRKLSAPPLSEMTELVRCIENDN